MCHDSIGMPSPSATCWASTVLPVPGSPFSNSGRSRAIAQLTASTSGPEAIYPGVPWKRRNPFPVLIRCSLSRLQYRDRLSSAPGRFKAVCLAHACIAGVDGAKCHKIFPEEEVAMATAHPIAPHRTHDVLNQPPPLE